jgi:hypothetical protein
MYRDWVGFLLCVCLPYLFLGRALLVYGRNFRPAALTLALLFPQAYLDPRSIPDSLYSTSTPPLSPSCPPQCFVSFPHLPPLKEEAAPTLRLAGGPLGLVALSRLGPRRRLAAVEAALLFGALVLLVPALGCLEGNAPAALAPADVRLLGRPATAAAVVVVVVVVGLRGKLWGPGDISSPKSTIITGYYRHMPR